VDKHNAILFYISDHGSFLGENFIYANGSNNDASAQAHNVPMFIYFSEKLQKKYWNTNGLKCLGSRGT
jgi:glucan phosphoethanolaminetransferase (alkaline phosphatase superfamily)